MLIGGCIVIPHPVTPNVERVDQVAVSSDVYITVGPRKLLEKVSSQIEKNSDNIEVIDPLVFRDAAFPDGGWSLNELLSSPRCIEITERLNVDYLILVGMRATEEGDLDGFFIPLVAGAGSIPEESSLSALVIDLRRQSIVCEFVATAESTGRMLYYVIVVVGTNPMTESAVIKGIADGISKELSQLGSGEVVRIAVLAAEGRHKP
jgi:hypothetical protein